MSGLHAADGSINITIVSGLAITGLYAADGSLNIVIRNGLTITGIYHPCGAINAVVTTGSVLGFYHPCGAMNISVSPYVSASVHVTVVSGSITNIFPNHQLDWPVPKGYRHSIDLKTHTNNLNQGLIAALLVF